MSEPDVNGISARLWRLPKQLLLALINATAILVIVAAIVALVAIARINHFAENIVATMTEAVLAKVDLPSKDVLANLRNLTTEVRTVGNALREIKTGEHPALQTEMVQLREALTVLNASINRFGSARSFLTDEAIGQLGRTVNDALTKLRDCSSNARQIAAHRTLGNKTVEARRVSSSELKWELLIDSAPSRSVVTPSSVQTGSHIQQNSGAEYLFVTKASRCLICCEFHLGLCLD